MCELFCLSSRVPTAATFSLDAFARRSGRETRNVGGWGLAFYNGRDVGLYREPEPAGDSAWLNFVEQRRLQSSLVISHIRHATHGAISLANTQPFARELGGRMHLFAHNGRLDDIEGRHAGEWERFQPIGDTDSEVAFCILLERLSDLWRGAEAPSLDDRVRVITSFAAELRQLRPANFLYADGDALVAHGHRRIQADNSIAPPGLWRLHRQCGGCIEALQEGGISIRAAGQRQENT